MYNYQGLGYIGEALIVFQKADNEVLGWVDWHGGDEAGGEVHGLVGQEDFSWGKKLPYNQNLELIWSQLVPDLVSRPAGLRFPGHQNQLSCEEIEEISMSLVP